MAVSEEIQRQVLAEATSVTPNYDVDYNDPRFTNVESEKNKALAKNEHIYDSMIDQTDQYFDKQIQASQDWADKQAQIQQEKTDFAIEQIEQQKEQANKDYIKEQSGAYVDWQKQSNAYGTQAEKMASAGLTNSGFSESSQVSMYNTYQNRVATAREVYNKAVLNYNNAIKDAQIQNNAILAEIAYQALEKQLELSLQGFQYKNTLVLEQANKQLEIDNMYYNRWQNVLQQINTENALAEEIRQFTENQKWQTEQNEIDRKFKAEQAEVERKFEAEQAELERKHDKEILEAKTKAEKEMLEQQHKNDLAKLEKQKQNELAILAQELANDKALLSYQKSLNKTAITGGSSTSKTTAEKNRGSSFTQAKKATNTKKITQTKQTTSSKNPTINMQSVLALGYGPISTDKLSTLVANGQVESYVKNGQTYFRKVPKYSQLKR